ncbi:hypothetical protein FGL86_11730 [Pistricoccus aurantiacus]|uniref:Uncharacterized protein n=1 Tax=Pistricoccus aurantiacus TaxID=1883414 RepID=A0A5B8SXW3_9GAMM|nr:hypothetical protein [Pistricoccus aurantiacus]QEA39673.1 hypothetical protein FGL86_11730 [Pistricoccus aurantiacus]
MVTVNGKLISTTENVPVEHHSVRADLFVALTVEPDDGESTRIRTPVSGVARASADGSFRISFDVDGELQGPVQFVVSAPNGLVVDRRELSLDDIANPVQIEIQPTSPFTIDESNVPGLGERQRVNGRIIDVTGLRVPPKLPVVIWGVDRVDGEAPPPRPLLVTETQVDGAFSGDWPDDVLIEAFGRVAGGEAVPVPLDEDARLMHDILLVTRVSPTDACKCTESPPRAPDPEDLTSNPEAFSQDLGGGCVDLTVPNRTLEEYAYYFVVRTSEPSIKGVTLGKRRKLPRDLLTDLLGVSLSSMALHGARLSSATIAKADFQLDIDSARRLVRTDAVPRPEDIERAAWLSEVVDTKDLIDTTLREESARQVLDADAPIDWDETPTIYLSTEIAFGHILQYREVWRADGYSLGDLLYSLPLAPGQRRQIAVVDWERRTRTAREESLEYEETMDALIERDRDVREIVGTDLHEQTAGGSRNTTWGAAGGIGAGFITSGFGIFGGVAGGASGSDTHAWQNAARQFSADSLQQLRDRIGQRASSVRSERSTVIQTVAQGESMRAETEAVANYNRCHAITVEYFEVLRHFLVTHELADVQECLFVPLPVTQFDRGKALRWREYLSRYLKDHTLLPGFDAIERVADNWVGWDYPVARYSEEAPSILEGELYVSFVLPRPRDADDGSFQLAEWEAYRDVLPGFARHIYSKLIEQAVAANKSVTAARDEAFQRDVAPQIAANLINRLHFAYVSSDGGETEVPLDGTLVSRYREDLPLYVTLSPAGELPQIPREDIAYFKLWYDGEPLPPDAKVVIHRGRLRYRTAHLTALLFDDDRILDDVRGGDPALVATPTSHAELRNPREEDRQLANRVVAHLNDNLEFYHQAIWISLDAQRRYMLLDAIEVPGQQGRSVASVCVNDLIGIAGNSLVLPAAPGQRLNTSVSATDEEGNPIDIRNAYATPPAPRMRLSVPTRGVYAEAVAGECSACEAIDDTRYWRWSVEGLLAPPEIQGPIDIGTRASEEPILTPTPLPAPLVSIQNAPAVPDPFGLKAAFELLSKPDLFHDITGLEGTQKNAAAAFDAALSAASAMGSEAAKLARQQELTKNADRVVDRIGKAVDDELLTPEAAQRLTKSLLEGLTGKEEPKAETPLEDPAVNKAVDAMSQAEGGKLKVEAGAETVEVSFDDTAPVVGAGSPVPRILPPLAAPHDSTDIPVQLEASFTGRHDPDNPLADDLTTFVLDTRDGLDFLLRPRGPNAPDPLAFLASIGMLLPGSDADHYRLRRPVHIVYPGDSQSNQVAGSGPLPIVVLQHGAHRSLAPGTSPGTLHYVDSYQGMQYLQDALAELGIVSVSVDANAANLFKSALIEMRALLVISALDTLRALHDDATSLLHDRLDFSRIGLVGHSRGGDAVVRAAKRMATDRPAYRVKFVCSLAPTDFSGEAKQDQRMALERSDCAFYAVLYGTQDNDVSGAGGANAMTGTGFRHYDRARTDKAMVFMGGCDHNRFNTVWMQDTGDEFGFHPDDVGDLLSEKSHQGLAKEYIGAVARWKLLGDASGKDLLDGQQLNQQGADVSLQWSFGEQVLVIDDMEDPVKPRTLHNAGVKVFADASISGHNLALETNHQTSVLVIDPNIAAPVPAALSMDLPASQRDWRDFSELLLRTTALFDLTDASTILQGKTPEFDVLVRDGSNNTVPLEQGFSPILAPSLPVFHRGFPSVPPIKSTTPDSASTILETDQGHGLSTGDTILIKMDTASPLDGVHTVASVLAPSDAGKPSTRFRVAVATPAAGGRGRIGKLENLSVQRLETIAYSTLPLDVALGNLILHRNDIRKLEIVPKADFPQHMFIDSIELVKG